MKSSRAFNIRAFAALITGSMFLLMLFTGLVMFAAPPGRLAFESGWHLLFLDKGQWRAIHLVSGLLFVGIAVWHLTFSWKPFVSYLRSRVNGRLVPRRELLVALFLASLTVAGTLAHLPPFQQLVDLSFGVGRLWGDGSAQGPQYGRVSPGDMDRPGHE